MWCLVYNFNCWFLYYVYFFVFLVLWVYFDIRDIMIFNLIWILSFKMFKYNIDIYLDKGNGLVCNKKKCL